ncbi:MAG TPA: RnfABCDGE type electron transport complex subunit D, partial [Terracidiphilus sp.]
STNLFLWFREDWFFLQFLLIATALASKELWRWKREGRTTHIFNPSAFGLFIFSVALIGFRELPISRAVEIAFTLSYPPHIYLEIFIIGLVVQALFSVTLVTLSSVATLWVFNVVYTQLTGLHQFSDSNMPVLVFLGAHLLVTDPATSPRTNVGKLVFGALYGASVFVLRGALVWLGIPPFYDKLLCVPVLNLTVQHLDRIGATVEGIIRQHSPPALFWRAAPANLLHMAVWVMVFTGMSASGFLGYTDVDPSPGSWRLGCIHGRGSDCIAWLRQLQKDCEQASGLACFTRGRVLADGTVVPPDFLSAQGSFDRACRLGPAVACRSYPIRPRN